MSAETVAGLRARITLLRPEPTGDDIGGAVAEYVSAGDVWARISASGASGLAVYDGEAARTGYRVEIRMHHTVRPGWRVVWRGRTLGVISIFIADLDLAFLTLNCEEEML